MDINSKKEIINENIKKKKNNNKRKIINNYSTNKLTNIIKLIFLLLLIVLLLNIIIFLFLYYYPKNQIIKKINNNICNNGFYIPIDNKSNCLKCSVENCERCYGNIKNNKCISCNNGFIPFYENNIIIQCK